MTNIADRSLYRQCTLKGYKATVRMVRVGARVYDRSKQRVTITTENKRLVVTGPVGERVVYTEEEFLENYKFDMTDKNRKKLARGKLFKVTSNEGGAGIFYLRVPAEESFILYDEYGSPVIGNVRDFSLDHAEGDCIVCPRAADGGPDLNKPRLMNGQVFSARYAI